MSDAPRPAIPASAVLVVGGVLALGATGWMGIAALLLGGSTGHAVLASIVLVPAAVLALQFAMMAPSARRPSGDDLDGPDAPAGAPHPRDAMARELATA